MINWLFARAQVLLLTNANFLSERLDDAFGGMNLFGSLFEIEKDGDDQVFGKSLNPLTSNDTMTPYTINSLFVIKMREQ